MRNFAKAMKLFLVLSLFLILGVSGCTSAPVDGSEAEIENETSDSSSEAIETTTEDEWPSDLPQPPEANPINLDISTEADISVSEIIWPDDGGVLVTTDSRGNVFTLTIPVDALLAPVEITMTPISGAEGLPDGEGLVGVSFEPEGLVFSGRASLTIDINEHSDLSDSFAFATLIDGEDFHLTPFQVEDNQVSFIVDHFSTSAVAAAGRSAISSASRRGMYNPSWGEARFKDEWSRALATIEPGPELREAYEDAFTTWFYSSVNTSAADAMINPLLNLERGVQEAVRWVKYLDDEDEGRFATEIDLLLGKMALAFKSAFAQSDLLCEFRDPDEAIRMVRWMAMVDAFPRYDLWALGIIDREEAIQKIEDCFSFDFEFRSRIISDAQMGQMTMQVALRQPINIEFDAHSFEIEEVDISLPYEILTMNPSPPAPCSLTNKQGLVTIKLWAAVNLSYAVQEVSSMWVEFRFLEKPGESFSCEAVGFSSTLWHANFSSAHVLVGRAQDVGAELTIVRNFTEYARFDFEGTSSLGGNITTEMRLKHTPE